MRFSSWLSARRTSGNVPSHTEWRQRLPRPRWWRLFVEQLEDRLTPSTFTWVGATGGDWDTLANWQVGGVTATVLPGGSDTADFNNFSGTVAHGVSGRRTRSTTSSTPTWRR